MGKSKGEKKPLSKKQKLMIGAMGCFGFLLLLLVILSPSPHSDPGETETQVEQVEVLERTQRPVDNPPAALEALEEAKPNLPQRNGENGLQIIAPADAEWVVRFGSYNDILNIGRQAPVRQLMQEVRFIFSLPVLNGAFYGSGFNPVQSLGGIGETLIGPITFVGVRTLGRTQYYAYAQVRPESWSLWENRNLARAGSRWRRDEDGVYIHQLSLDLPFGEVRDPLLLVSNGRILCIALGEEAMEHFIRSYRQEHPLLEINRFDSRSRRIQFYASESMSHLLREMAFDQFIPELIRGNRWTRTPVYGSAPSLLEGTIDFDSDQTVIAIRQRRKGDSPPASLRLKNTAMMDIPRAVPGDAISFFRVRSNIGEVLRGIASGNRSDRGLADRLYTAFAARNQFFPLEGIESLMGEDVYQFVVPSRRVGDRLATVWVASVADGQLAANALATILRAESSGRVQIRAQQSDSAVLYEFEVQGKPWFIIGTDTRVFLTDEILAIMDRPRSGVLAESLSLPDEMLADQSLIFFRNSNQMPRVLNLPPDDLSSHRAIWWFISRAYPHQFGVIRETPEGDHLAETWMRF